MILNRFYGKKIAFFFHFLASKKSKIGFGSLSRCAVIRIRMQNSRGRSPTENEYQQFFHISNLSAPAAPVTLCLIRQGGVKHSSKIFKSFFSYGPLFFKKKKKCIKKISRFSSIRQKFIRKQFSDQLPIFQVILNRFYEKNEFFFHFLASKKKQILALVHYLDLS